MRLLGRLPDGVGVGERPVGVHADEVGAGNRKRARTRAGRDDEGPVGEALAARELDLVLVRVDRLDRRVEAELDDCLLPLLRCPDERLLALELAAQVALRQRRPVVRRVGLGAERS